MTRTLDKTDYDVVMLQEKTDDGGGVWALRSRPGKLEYAQLRPLEEGKDISRTEVVSLKPHESVPLLYNVETVYKPESEWLSGKSQSRTGPPRVTNTAYRENWGKIFDCKKQGKPVLN